MCELPKTNKYLFKLISHKYHKEWANQSEVNLDMPQRSSAVFEKKKLQNVSFEMASKNFFFVTF